ncbi:MAG: iron-sulfur cluster repair di-iron protein [Ignavibacteriae bacterium]|nr:iron-sulfur cluster repair di-iron protein [Ignavibacteriota bacterium]
MNIKIDSNSRIGEIVKNNYKTAEVFKKYNIDFCCGGDQTIFNACIDIELNSDELIAELLNKNNQPGDVDRNYKDWTVDFLAKYILNIHHAYIKKNIPILVELTNKIANRHGSLHPELFFVNVNFLKVAEELQLHMMKEERILFPYIIKLYEAYNNSLEMDKPAFGTIANPIKMMEEEHEEAGNLLGEIRKITNDFTLPDDACNSYAITFKKLDEFENDLHLHIHLENNILFPDSIELERKYFER